MAHLVPRISIKMMLIGVAVLSAFLAITAWHPLIGVPMTIIGIISLGMFVLTRHTSLMPMIVLFSGIVLGITGVWLLSLFSSFVAVWTPNNVRYELLAQQHSLLAFRYLQWETPERFTLAIVKDTDEIWTDWPGFNQIHYTINYAHFTLAHGRFSPPFALQFRRQLNFDCLSIPYWFLILPNLIVVGLFTRMEYKKRATLREIQRTKAVSTIR